MMLFIRNLTSLQNRLINIFVVILCGISTVNVSSQSLHEELYFLKILRTTNNFQKIERKVEDYYADKYKGKGSGYKQWKRWQNFYKNRLLSDGTVPNLGAIELNAVKKSKLFAKKKSEYLGKAQTTGNWRNINLGDYTRFGGGYNGGLGRVNCIQVDPDDANSIYVGTPAGGLWRSTTRGNSWEPLTDNLPSLGISGIAIDYNTPITNRTIYILTGDGDGGHTASTGVLKSIDNGVSWTKTGLSFDILDSKRGYKLVIDPFDSNILMAAMQGGIYRTTDAGVNWELVRNDFRIYDIEFKPRSSTVYASGNGVFYKSTNSGQTWNQIRDGLPLPSGRTAIAVTSKKSSYVYLLFSSVSQGEFTGIYRSTDSGNTFSLRSNKPNILGYDRFGGDNRSQSNYDLALAVSPTDAEEVHVGAINCWKSANGGATWENTSYWREDIVSANEYTHADIHSLEYVGNTLFVGSDGGIYKTENKAVSWESISSGLNISQPYKIGLDPTNADRFVFGSQDNGSNKYEDGTYFHWFGADGFESIIDPSNPERIYGSFQYGGLNRSDNNGVSSVRITPKEDDGTVVRGDWSTPYALDPENSNVIYAGYRDVYKSNDRGASWTKITDENIGFNNSEHLAIAPSDSKYIYVIKGNTFYYSHNAGSSWDYTEVFGSSLTYMAVHPENPKAVWVTKGSFNEGSKVYKSVDGGASFTNISGALPNIPVNCIVYEKGTNDGLYIGTDIGVFYKNNSLSDWEVYSDNLPNTIVTELEIQYLSDKLYAATFGRGVWISDLYATSDNNNDANEESCLTNTTTWVNTALDNQMNDFEVRFSVTPKNSNMDAVIGLSNKAVNSYNDMGMIVRFNKTGTIDVRNGSNYLAATSESYLVGDTYDFRIVIDFENKQYNVYVSKNGTAEQVLADRFDFRTQQSSLSNVNNWATFGSLGVLEVCDFEIVSKNKFPVIVMTSPLNNTTFEAGSTIMLSSDASDADGTIVRVTWFQNGTRIRSDSGEPYTKPWIDVPAGNYEITATAEDNTGAITTSVPVNIRVVAQGSPLFCETTSSNWSGTAMGSSEQDSFEVNFEITPNANNMDGVVGLSNGSASKYSDLATIIRLNKQGVFDVRNGNNYQNSAVVTYEAALTYIVRFDVNISAKTYNVYVTPPSGSEVQIANGYNFRTDQSSVTELNHWSWISGVGTHTVCLETVNDSEITPEDANSETPESLTSNIELINHQTLGIIPNPATSKVSFLFDTNSNDQVRVKLFDALGKVVKSTYQHLHKREVVMDVSSLPNGMYFVRASVGNSTLNKKLVIRR